MHMLSNCACFKCDCGLCKCAYGYGAKLNYKNGLKSTYTKDFVLKDNDPSNCLNTT